MPDMRKVVSAKDRSLAWDWGWQCELECGHSRWVLRRGRGSRVESRTKPPSRLKCFECERAAITTGDQSDA